MAHMKSEDGNTSIWQGYSLQTPTTSVPPQPQPYDASFSSFPMAMPTSGRAHKGPYRSLDIPPIQTRPPPRGGNSMILTASPPPLMSHHSFPSLKRAFHSTEDLSFGSNFQEFREDLSEQVKPTISQDHRLLSFARRPEKHTILDSQGRVQRIELSAQIHGMFFLSELATTPGESLLVQPELTCYRRNLFQITGNVTAPRGNLSLVTERGDRIPIISTEVIISATESVDGNVVKLIVIPWKTPPPNSPEIPTGQEHEPATIPLSSFDEGPESSTDFVVYPIAYRRLQFRIATANNGRRRELQQHFTLHLNVVGTLANGVKLNVCETSTAAIVVRGRSPRNFQARKEIPLVGSSSSRGNAPDLQITTNIPPGTMSSMDEKLKMTRPQQVELPRSPFTFDSSSIVGSPSMTRQAAYPAWTAAHTPDHGTTPTSPAYPPTSMGLDNYLHLSVSNPDLQAHTHAHIISPQQSSPPIPMPMSIPMPMPMSMPPPRQFAYHPAPQHAHVSVPAPPPPTPNEPLPLRYIDNNPRPAKSPRHILPPGVQPLASNVYADMRFAPPYAGPQTRAPIPQQEYFPPVMPVWSGGPGVGGGYQATTSHEPVTNTGLGVQQYDFANESYGRHEDRVGAGGGGGSAEGHQHYTWSSG